MSLRCFFDDHDYVWDDERKIGGCRRCSFTYDETETEGSRDGWC